MGMGWIASYLESNGFKVDLVDLQISEKTFKEVLQDSRPRVLGIGGTSHTRYESFRLAKEAKEYGVTVFALVPGAVLTKMTEFIMESPEGKKCHSSTYRLHVYPLFGTATRKEF